MKLVATIISIIFHPLLMITYGVLMAFFFSYLIIYPLPLKLYLVGGTFVCTAVAPAFLILLMMKRGAVGDLELTDRRERAVPYLIYITSILTCLFYFLKMQMPFWLLSLLLGTSFALIVAFCINFFWKISAHAIGIGGLLGAIMGVSRIQMINPFWLFILVLIAAGLVGMSRIFLNKHTPMQVYAGFSLGFVCTFVASLFGFVYLFI